MWSSEFDYVIVDLAVELTDIGLVQRLTIHDVLDVLLVDVVVLVKADGDVSDLLLLLCQQVSDALLALIEDLNNLLVDEGKSLLTHLALVSRDVSSILSKHAERLNSTVGHLGGVHEVVTASCGDLVVSDKEFLSTVASHSNINLGQHPLFGERSAIGLIRNHESCS